MNPIYAFLIEIGLTLLVCLVVVSYIRPHLLRILVDLCGTEDRARFWTNFTNVVLVTFPLITSLGFSPYTSPKDSLIYDIAHQLKSNLFTFILSLVFVGFVLLLFIAMQPRTRPQTKQE